jgi:pilus assembly protein CpaE
VFKLKATLIGTESFGELQPLLAGLAIPVGGRHLDVGTYRRAVPGGPDADTLFVVGLRGEEDLTGLRQLSDAFPSVPTLAVVAGPCTAETLYRVNRSGAAQMVPEHWQPDDFCEAIERLARQFGRAPARALVVAVVGVAEGCGATTLAVNLAWELRTRWNKRCVLAEPLAPVGRLAAWLGKEAPPAPATLFAGGPADPAAVRRARTEVFDGLSVLPGPPFGQASPRPDAGQVLPVLECLRRQADVVVLDLSLAFEDSHQELARRADQVLLVTAQQIPALQGLRVFAEGLARHNPTGRIVSVVNRFDPGLPGFTATRIRETFGLPEVWTVAEDSLNCRAAINEGKPLRQESPRSPAVRDMDRLLHALFGPPPGAPRRSIFDWLSR